MSQKKQITRIENPRKLAAAFAVAVTAPTPVGRGWIARNGQESLFRTLQLVMPQVFQNRIYFKPKFLVSDELFTDHPTGKQRPSFSLERANIWFRIQQTRAKIVRICMCQNSKEESHEVTFPSPHLLFHVPEQNCCRSAGNWLFCNRRWLNPEDPTDRSLLEENYATLASMFPEFGAVCSKANFILKLSEVIGTWIKITWEGAPVNGKIVFLSEDAAINQSDSNLKAPPSPSQPMTKATNDAPPPKRGLEEVSMNLYCRLAKRPKGAEVSITQSPGRDTSSMPTSPAETCAGGAGPHFDDARMHSVHISNPTCSHSTIKISDNFAVGKTQPEAFGLADIEVSVPEFQVWEQASWTRGTSGAFSLHRWTSKTDIPSEKNVLRSSLAASADGSAAGGHSVADNAEPPSRGRPGAFTPVVAGVRRCGGRLVQKHFAISDLVRNATVEAGAAEAEAAEAMLSLCRNIGTCKGGEEENQSSAVSHTEALSPQERQSQIEAAWLDPDEPSKVHTCPESQQFPPLLPASALHSQPAQILRSDPMAFSGSSSVPADDAPPNESNSVAALPDDTMAASGPLEAGPVRRWLKELGLDIYADLLIMEGWDSVEVMNCPAPNRPHHAQLMVYCCRCSARYERRTCCGWASALATRARFPLALPTSS